MPAARLIYSREFIAVAGLASTATYFGDLDFVLILRSVDIYCDSGGLGDSFYLMGSAGQTIWYIDTSGPGATNAHWRGRQVIPAGADFSVRASAPTDVSVSGYALTV